MLENFHLAAIAENGQELCLYHIPLHRDLQYTLSVEWNEQRDSFLEDIDEIDFDPGYTLEECERFRLLDFQPPQWLRNETSQTVSMLPSMRLEAEEMGRIKALAGFAQDEDGHEIVLFQNFSRSRVIRPGKFLFLQNDTYESLNCPGMTLDSKLASIFLFEGGKLLFRSFRISNTFLPLAQFYSEASEQEIREVLEHEVLVAEDVDALAIGANQWFRKRFAMLRDSHILDRYSAQQIVAQSNGYDIDIRLDNNRIVFPAEKAAAKRLLQFLNEEIFRGAITETLYETNSKREAD